MTNIESLCHTKWDCKYHVVFIPKCRRKVIYGKIRVRLREILHQLAAQKECTIEEGNLCSDHVHMLCISGNTANSAEVFGLPSGRFFEG